jgi:hypothetical protein
MKIRVIRGENNGGAQVPPLSCADRDDNSKQQVKAAFPLAE